MRIGSIDITSVVDGEITIPTEGLWTGKTNEDWGGYSFTGCHLTKDPVQTVGSFLISGLGDRLVLVDAGLGNNPTFPFRGGALRSALLSLGVRPNDITDVLFTHLHSDHIGWASLNGKPFFENATYRCDKRDWDYFMGPDYVLPDWMHVLAKPEFDAPQPRLGPIADRMQFWEGDEEILPGLEVIDAAGHTPGTSIIEVRSDGEEGFILGDLVHGYAELVDEGWELSIHYDGAAADAAVQKWSRQLSDSRAPFVASHFPGMRWGRFDSGLIQNLPL
jgi:glyoxylase-like metal-dependent hydrolase (beta-lactamase superfamily II)